MSNFASRFSSLLITTERCFAENAVNGDQLKYEEERNLKERARKTRLKETKAEREREERQQLQGLEDELASIRLSNSEQVSRTKFEAERLQRQLESLDAELHNLLTDKDAEETLRSKYRMEREMKERDEIQIETELEALKRKRKGDEIRSYLDHVEAQVNDLGSSCQGLDGLIQNRSEAIQDLEHLVRRSEEDLERLTLEAQECRSELIEAMTWSQIMKKGWDVQTKLVEVANTERIVDLQVERIGVARSALEDIEKQVEQDQQLICNNNAIVKELEEARRRIQQKSVGSQTEAQK